MAIMATALMLLLRWKPERLDTPLRTGIAFGVITYFVMNWVVVPLRFGTPLPPKTLSIVTQLFAHIVLVGIPMAYVARALFARLSDPLANKSHYRLYPPHDRLRLQSLDRR